MMRVFHRTVVGCGISSNSWRARCSWPSLHRWLKRKRIVLGLGGELWSVLWWVSCEVLHGCCRLSSGGSTAVKYTG
ncbi:hypothetical protein MIMGU_mgv1a017444mg [Erythranthe guttata]|uniref:Uncharacterized protein n=1 Tax=Erythranthe guttata TaxID=4155 RepID=A0A022RIQ5_ERYGU|nr:hypothetical protein MIMGU_mgv1a017444mg [Erythranthe guttata]